MQWRLPARLLSLSFSKVRAKPGPPLLPLGLCPQTPSLFGCHSRTDRGFSAACAVFPRLLAIRSQHCGYYSTGSWWQRRSPGTRGRQLVKVAAWLLVGLAVVGFPEHLRDGPSHLSVLFSAVKSSRRWKVHDDGDDDGGGGDEERMGLLPRTECEGNLKRDMGPWGSAVWAGRDLLQKVKDEVGAPGMVVGVSVNGEVVWTEGLGFADLENRLPCHSNTVMRVASVSKSLTTAALARLWEAGKVDLDAPVQTYVPDFPEKEFQGQKVTITPRQILSHFSGIRHYEKDPQKVRDEEEKRKKARSGQKVDRTEKKASLASKNNSEDKKKHLEGNPKETDKVINAPKLRGNSQEFSKEEYYLMEKFSSVSDSLKLFKNDPLIYRPGTEFLYSTHAFTLLSSVVESCSGDDFVQHMLKMFRQLNMLNTLADLNEPIIYNRSRYYVFNKRGRIVNAQYVDNSYKWAGGGFLSTVGDLLKFANAMLYSYQTEASDVDNGHLPGYLKSGTMRALWSPVPGSEMSWDREGGYGMGWGVVESRQECGACRRTRRYASHTGGAVGASSVLLVLPAEGTPSPEQGPHLPRGIAVCILCNLQSVGLNAAALQIALEFERCAQKTVCEHCP
ncbi:serine beta-lactamase-like protein LACTB, mitochondrial [Lampetra fluviatilis]